MATVTSTAAKDNIIRVGDYISLKFPRRRSYLSAEGILVEDVYTSPSITCFEEHLFQIYVQRQYSATNELRDFLANNPEVDNGKADLDLATTSHYEALIRGKENEFTLNRTVMKSKTGNVLYFGDTIQLLHVKSRKYITAIEDLARDERENMKVILNYDGSVQSWIKVMPKFKINREGEPIANGTEVLLKFSERNNEFLHVADRQPPRGKSREVNTSIESPTGWKLNLFQKASDLNNASLLLSGQLVYLRDPESLSMLCPLSLPISLDFPKVQTQYNDNTALTPHEVYESPWNASTKIFRSSKSLGLTSDGDVVNVNDIAGDNDSEKDGDDGQDGEDMEEEDDDVSLDSFDEFVKDYGGVVLKPGIEEAVDLDSVWMLESKNISKGGPILYKNDKLMFRHINTGKYLGLEQREDGSDAFTLSLENEPSERSTLFYISELHSPNDYLGNGKAVQIKHAYYGVTLQRGEYKDGQRVFSCLTTRNKNKAVSMIINRYVQKESIMTGPSMSPMNEETLDIYFGKAVMQHISRFVKLVTIPTIMTPDATNIWPRLDLSDVAFFPLLIARTTLFVQGMPIQIKVGNEGFSNLNKSMKNYIKRRQNMLREFGLVEAMMVMIQKLQSISDLVNNGASSNRLMKGSFVEQGREVLSDVLQLLYELIKENTTSQLYIADHLLVILAHVSTDRVAAKVAQELLSGNRELQETKIGLREITIFTEKMKEVHMNSMYLHLLQTCCSCLGQGLTKNQDIVNKVLFHKYREVLIEARLDNSIRIPCDWTVTSPAYELYLATRKESPGLLVNDLLTAGLPSIRLKWKINSARFSIERVFNKTEILLAELEVKDRAGKRNSITTSTMAPTSPDDIRTAIHDFFNAQMTLAGEMCLGRNYHTLQQIEKVYPYSMLVTILKGAQSEAVRGSAAYLLQCAFVDRDPQSEIPLPRLTRTVTEVSRSNFSELVTVSEAQGGNKFAILQYLIGYHLDGIKDKIFPVHSYNMLDLLHSLIKFHFYGNVSYLDSTVKSLVACLKRGEFDLHADMTMSNMSSSMQKLSMSMKKSSSKISRASGGGGGGGGGNSGSVSAKNKGNNSNLSLIPEEGEDDSKMDNKTINNDFTTNTMNNNNHNNHNHHHSKVGLDGSEIPTEFYAKGLYYIECLPAQLFMLFFVVVSCGISVYQLVVNDDSEALNDFQIAIFALFAIELIAHMFFHIMVHKSVLTFFYNPYHCLDFLTVILYVLVFVSSSTLLLVKFGRLVRFIRFLRFMRFIMLCRIFHTIEAAKEIRDALNREVIYTWDVPARYVKTSPSILKTLEKAVNILYTIQLNMLDRKLSTFLKTFTAELQSSKPKDPAQIFKAVLDTCSDLEVSNEHYDNIYMDLIMYAQPSLVQSTLDLLMEHHSSYRILLDNINKLQLITSQKDEENFDRLEKVVNQLKRNADTHDIWGKIDTPERKQINQETHHYLSDLTKQCKKLRDILSFDESHEPIKFIQNILRNLGCFEVCMTLAGLIQALDKEATLDESYMNTVNLALAANRLLYWLILDNPTNQSLAYGQFNFFVKTIDSKIESHRVIRAMFHDNIDLMEKVPKKYISEFVDMICNIGRFPQYLSLMSSIINVGEKNVIGNQYEVIRLMSSPDHQKKIVQFFVPITHPDYAKKIRLMSQYLAVKDVTVDALPSDLAYHLQLMELLSSCTIGTTGMTSIEAKVQSIFPFVDLIDAMLDNQCLLLAKVKYGLYLYNAMLDVETPIPALKDAACIWKILVAAQDVFTFAKDELRQMEKNGWDAPTSCRQKIEYMLVNAMIVCSYFSAYYDHTIYKPEVGQLAVGVERIHMKESQGNEIIRSLFRKIAPIYEMLSPLLPLEHHELLYETLVVLNKCAKEKIVADVANIHSSFYNTAQQYITANNNDDDNKTAKAYEALVLGMNSSTTVKEMINTQVIAFIQKIEKLPSKTMNNLQKADLRFEPFIEKLVSHVRSCIQIIIHGDETIKFMTPNATKTSIWILKVFLSMIENSWGMDIYERDEDGGAEQDAAVAGLMVAFNQSGMTQMCLDLIAKGIDVSLQSEALKLLVGMLFKEGGAIDIQKTIHAHLSQPGSDMFFRTVRQILHNIMSWHEWNKVILLEDGNEPNLPDEIIIIRCLQLMCEGHFKPNQDIIREQPQNNVSINLLDDFVLYLQKLDRYKCQTSTVAGLAVVATILEVIQGPCEKNQDHFALNSELIETLNRKLRQHPENDCIEADELEFKKTAIDIFQALLEGQGRKVAIYERMLSVIHVDVLVVLCKGELKPPHSSNKTAAAMNNDDPAATATMIAKEESNNSSNGPEEESDESIGVRVESLVLLQMLIDFRPELKKELSLPDDLSKEFGQSVACIEVVWRGELQRRFFHVPDICSLLAESTRQHFIVNVKRTSTEDKLYGLLEAAKEMYREVLHQKYLKECHLDTIFSRNNLASASWFNFYVAVAINILFIIFYKAEDVPCAEKINYGIYKGEEAYYYSNQSYYYYNATLGSAVQTAPTVTLFNFCTDVVISDHRSILAIFILTFVLIAGATFVLLSHVIVRAPNIFLAYAELGWPIYKCLFFTIFESSFLYYLFYLGVTIVSIFYHPASAVVLFDFIRLSPTSQSILDAIYVPRRQILMTIVLVLISIYIFAFFEFFFFATPNNFNDDYSVNTLQHTFKFLLRYGLPYFSPENEMVLVLHSFRVLCDIAFFLATIILINVLKGIVIDTFVALRAKLEKRLDDTEQKCFICGIDKNTFNRTLDRNAFRQHIQEDQHLWNYLYFIMFLWEQDKDDDDGFEWYARRCIENNDLTWFPMNKAIRLAIYQEKGDIHSMKYRFRKELLQQNEFLMQQRMVEFKSQVSSTIARVEKALEFETDVEFRRTRANKASRGSILFTRSSMGVSGNSSAFGGGGGTGTAGSSIGGLMTPGMTGRSSKGSRQGSVFYGAGGGGGGAGGREGLSRQSTGEDIQGMIDSARSRGSGSQSGGGGTGSGGAAAAGTTAGNTAGNASPNPFMAALENANKAFALALAADAASSTAGDDTNDDDNNSRSSTTVPFTPPPMMKKISFSSTIASVAATTSGTAANAAATAAAANGPGGLGVSASASTGKTALEMENSGQMHLRVLYISGLILPADYVRYVTIRVTSDHDTAVFKPIQDVQVVARLSNVDTTNSSNGGSMPMAGSRGSLRSSMASGGGTGTGAGGAMMMERATSEAYLLPQIEQVSSSIRYNKVSLTLDPAGRSPATTAAASAATAAVPHRKSSFAAASNAGSYYLSNGLHPRLSFMRLQYDVLENPAVMVHQGNIPKFDVAKIFVRVQIILEKPQSAAGTSSSTKSSNRRGLFLGGVRIPLVTLLNQSMEGGTLEVTLSQRYNELLIPAIAPPLPPPAAVGLDNDGSMKSRRPGGPPGHHIDNVAPFLIDRAISGSGAMMDDDLVNVIIPQNDEVKMAVSAVASRRLLQDWALLHYRANH